MHLRQCQLDDKRVFNEARNSEIASKLLITIATACMHAYMLHCHQLVTSTRERMYWHISPSAASSSSVQAEWEGMTLPQQQKPSPITIYQIIYYNQSIYRLVLHLIIANRS